MHCAYVLCASVICITSTSATFWINYQEEKNNTVREANGEALLCARAVCARVHVRVCRSYFSLCHKVRARVECELCLKGGKPAEAL